MGLKVKADSKEQIAEYNVEFERVDNSTHSQIDEDLKKIAEEKCFIVVNLENVKYISSVGIRVILATANLLRNKKGDIVLTGVQAQVAEVLNMSGLKEMVRTELSNRLATEALLEGYKLY